MDILVSVLAMTLALVAVIVKLQHRGKAARESCPPSKDEVLLI